MGIAVLPFIAIILVENPLGIVFSDLLLSTIGIVASPAIAIFYGVLGQR